MSRPAPGKMPGHDFSLPASACHVAARQIPPAATPPPAVASCGVTPFLEILLLRQQQVRLRETVSSPHRLDVPCCLPRSAQRKKTCTSNPDRNLLRRTLGPVPLGLPTAIAPCQASATSSRAHASLKAALAAEWHATQPVQAEDRIQTHQMTRQWRNSPGTIQQRRRERRGSSALTRANQEVGWQYLWGSPQRQIL